MQNLAQVNLWGQRVGALAFDPATQFSRFEYDPEFIATGIEIAPLHMPAGNLSSARNSFQRSFSFPDLHWATYKGLPAAFADTLPDDFGNAVIDAWLVRNGRDPNTFQPLERLLYTGSRGMGALEYAPAIESPKLAENIELQSLLGMAQSVLDQRANLQARLNDTEESLSQLLQVGTSAGGARAKALIAIDAQRKNIRSGQLQAPEGFEHFLLKFDGVVEQSSGQETFADPQGFGRMEYAYYLMAKAAGIDMAHCELLEEEQRAHFMTRRFDREGTHKKHYQSLCAMDHANFKQPGSYSYEQLFMVARRLRLKRRDAEQIYRRMVFNVIARNHDDHSKNFGFLLPGPNASWELAPAFDVAYSYKPGSPWVNSHQLSINGKRDDFVREDLLAVASQISNFSRTAKDIIEEVLGVVSQWPKYANKAGVFSGFTKEIAVNLRLHL